MCPASLTTHEATVTKSPPATAPPNGALQDATGGMLVPVLQVAGAARSSNASATGPVKKSRKMQVGKGQNGQNLCARERLTRNKAGTATEFKAYFDGSSAAERKSYDELAAKKVAAGEWSR
ncbi:hypothetical protein M405DRAFT_820234 [Rhizopogon salebrosus TDB-379]|nr:hypothetical protein M405DRAFT_820234 [Rhizopogon salebrosus TDB-379]